MKRCLHVLFRLIFLTGLNLSLRITPSAADFPKAKDPGVRLGAPGAGAPIEGLSPTQLSSFQMGKEEFVNEESVTEGLGPRMNLDSCVGCHTYPAAGGSSPFTNPQLAFAKKYGANNTIPQFISLNGAIREARLVKYPDGSPYFLF